MDHPNHQSMIQNKCLVLFRVPFKLAHSHLASWPKKHVGFQDLRLRYKLPPRNLFSEPLGENPYKAPNKSRKPCKRWPHLPSPTTFDGTGVLAFRPWKITHQDHFTRNLYNFAQVVKSSECIFFRADDQRRSYVSFFSLMFLHGDFAEIFVFWGGLLGW